MSQTILNKSKIRQTRSKNCDLQLENHRFSQNNSQLVPQTTTKNSSLIHRKRSQPLLLMVVLEKAVALIRKRSPCAVQLENRSRAAAYRLPMRVYLLHQPLAKAQHLLSRTQTRVQVHARQEPRWPLRLLERRSRLYLHSPARPCKSPQRVENHSSEKVLS